MVKRVKSKRNHMHSSDKSERTRAQWFVIGFIALFVLSFFVFARPDPTRSIGTGFSINEFVPTRYSTSQCEAFAAQKDGLWKVADATRAQWVSILKQYRACAPKEEEGCRQLYVQYQQSYDLWKQNLAPAYRVTKEYHACLKAVRS